MCVCLSVCAIYTGLPSTKYDLISNIVHEGKAGEGVYRLHVHRKVEEIWCGRSYQGFHITMKNSSCCCMNHDVIA